jgi:hypothetical protein
MCGAQAPTLTKQEEKTQEGWIKYHYRRNTAYLLRSHAAFKACNIQ